jgi:hypothetical protein
MKVWLIRGAVLMFSLQDFLSSLGKSRGLELPVTARYLVLLQDMIHLQYL